jgi:hypothetical protein
MKKRRIKNKKMMKNHPKKSRKHSQRFNQQKQHDAVTARTLSPFFAHELLISDMTLPLQHQIEMTEKPEVNCKVSLSASAFVTR